MTDLKETFKFLIGETIESGEALLADKRIKVSGTTVTMLHDATTYPVGPLVAYFYRLNVETKDGKITGILTIG